MSQELDRKLLYAYPLALRDALDLSGYSISNNIRRICKDARKKISEAGSEF